MFKRFFKKSKKSGIETALDDGRIIHGFLSGGGLRVIRIENMLKHSKRGNKLHAYGEHPDVNEALKHADEDYLAGGRKYEDVYGKLHPNYLTGSSSSTSDLDLFLRKGNSFDCFKRGERVVVRLNAWVHVDMSEEIKQLSKDKIVKRAGPFNSVLPEPVYWRDQRGFVFETIFSHGMFANGDDGWTTRTVVRPEKHQAHQGSLYEDVFEGEGKSLQDAFEVAHAKFKIPPKFEILTSEQASKAYPSAQFWSRNT